VPDERADHNGRAEVDVVRHRDEHELVSARPHTYTRSTRWRPRRRTSPRASRVQRGGGGRWGQLLIRVRASSGLVALTRRPWPRSARRQPRSPSSGWRRGSRPRCARSAGSGRGGRRTRRRCRR
jgi:hypothetical protein